MKSRIACVAIILLSLGSLNRCVEPFDLEVPGGSTFLVIDGLITDQAGPYTVKLSSSSDLALNEFAPVRNADVSIQEEDGIVEFLTEQSEGEYSTAMNGIQGQPGKRYRLEITRPGGAVYQSEWVLLKPSPTIDSVYWRFETKETEAGTLEGVQLYLDTHDPNNNNTFYRYEWTETWQYTVPFPASFEYLGNFQTKFIQVNRSCYISQASSTISIASSSKNALDIISEHPLLYVSTETNRLTHRYSIDVTQFALNENEYTFWKGLQETSSESGSLFDTQPQSVAANVKNLSNPNEPVLGFFSASGVTSHRIFIDREELPVPLGITSYTDACDLERIPFTDPFGEDRILNNGQGKVFYEYYGLISPIGWLLTPAECSDCTVVGGSVEKPTFWVD